MTKKIRADNMESRVDGGRMYKVKRCPVAAFEKFLSKLNPKCSSLFQTLMPTAPISSDKQAIHSEELCR